jgi:two-component system cell cycle response regulator DivK
VSRAHPLVLIVDDDERNRKLAADLLRLADYSIVEAATGAEALDVARADPPNVILMDLRLPDVDGAQVAGMLRADSRTSSVPVIALTAMSLEGDEDWLRAAGFAGYIQKPIDVEQFCSLVAEFLRRDAGDAPEGE